MESSDHELEELRQLLSELTRRVFRIEQALKLEPLPVTVKPGPPAPATAQPPPVLAVQAEARPPAPPRSPKVTGPAQEINLESRIGSHWLNRIGISAVLIGVSYFLKYAFENNWIGPAGRVAIGLLAGIAVVIWSERFRTRGYQIFSYSLKAIGVGVLYLSLWAAFQVYSLFPSGVAFTAMLAVTASTAALALWQDAEILAAFALVGGFATPLLLSTGQNREMALFSYVGMLDAASLAMIAFRPWRRLLVLSFAGTLLLYLGWYSTFYRRSEFQLTLFFASVFFVVFAIAPLIARRPLHEDTPFSSVPLFLALANAAAYFLELYAMISEINSTEAAWAALALALIYIVLSNANPRGSDPVSAPKLKLLHLALAIGFITIAIPIRLDAHWITIGWFVESAVLLLVADRIHSDLLNGFALAALVLGVARLLFIDNFYSTQLIWNTRFATYVVAIVVLGLLAWFGSHIAGQKAKIVTGGAVIALNVLALIALSHEVADYYSWQMPTLRAGRWNRDYWLKYRHVEIARDFTYSALWMGYGAILMMVGFWRRSAFVRWQSLVLIAVTIAKVFLYDTSQLDRAYRILSFIILGVLLLAISFVYQRDWLRLGGNRQSSVQPERPARA